VPAEIRIIISSSSSGDALKQTRADVEALGDTAKKSGGGFNALHEVAVGALRKIGEVAISAGAQAAGAIAGFVKDSIGVAGDFEAAVNGFKAVTGDALSKAGLDFDDVRDKALQLGADTKFSAAQAIEAMTELAKGGVPVKDVMGGATDATLALAAAAQLQLGPAAEIVAKQLGVWGETGVTASQVADLLASAANASTVDVEGLALGLANAGGTAKTAGVSFQDLVQTMALIAPNFSSASDAGTSLKTFISRLIPTTDKATDAMVALGLATESGKSKFFDAHGAFIGMEAASRLLQQATKDLSEEEKLQAFNTIFGADAIRAAAAIANAGAEGFDAMGQSMTDAGGAAAAAAIQNQGFNFALEQMKGSLETLQIVLGTAFLPLLASLLNTYITPGINSVMTFAQALTGNSEAAFKLSAPLQAVALALRGVVEFATTGALDNLYSGLTTLFGAQTAGQIVDFIGTLKQVAAWLGENIPIAVQATADFWTSTLQPALSAVWTFIQTNVIPILSDVATWLIQNIPVAAQATANFWTTTLQPALAAVWTFIQTSVIPILSTVVTWLATNIPVAVRSTADFWNNTLKPALETVWGFINGSIIPIFEALANVAIAIMKKELEALAKLWSNILKPALEGVWAVIDKNIMPILKDLADRVKQGTVVELEALGKVLNAAKGWFGDVKEAISDVIKWLKDLATAISNIRVPDWLEGHSPPPMADWFGAIGSAAERATTMVASFGTALRTDVGDAIAAAVPTLTQGATNLGAQIVNAFAHGIVAPMTGAFGMGGGSTGSPAGDLLASAFGFMSGGNRGPRKPGGSDADSVFRRYIPGGGGFPGPFKPGPDDVFAAMSVHAPKTFAVTPFNGFAPALGNVGGLGLTAGAFSTPTTHLDAGPVVQAIDTSTRRIVAAITNQTAILAARVTAASNPHDRFHVQTAGADPLTVRALAGVI